MLTTAAYASLRSRGAIMRPGLSIARFDKLSARTGLGRLATNATKIRERA
jgi:hypothetical protein